MNRDNLKQRGAEELAARVRRYWRERGHDVSIVVEQHGAAPDNSYYVVRAPGLPNGMPVAMKVWTDKHPALKAVRS